MSRLFVERPGMFTTVQDAGRRGAAHWGVPAAGPLDRWSARLANRLVGNPDATAVLEITIIGPRLRSDRPALVAVTGATFTVEIDGRQLRSPLVEPVRAGAVISFVGREHGARAYLAVDGGFRLPSVLGSMATQIRSPFEGLAGRPLRTGDELPLGEKLRSAGVASNTQSSKDWWTEAHAGGIRELRVLSISNATTVAGAAEALCAAQFVVSANSDRMGYRLHGPVTWPPLPGSLLSAPTTLGAVQVPSGGEPILLMADHQTTGGYAQVAVLCRADRQVAGQLAPGDVVRFRAISFEQAAAAHQQREATLNALAPEVRS